MQMRIYGQVFQDAHLDDKTQPHLDQSMSQAGGGSSERRGTEWGVTSHKYRSTLSTGGARYRGPRMVGCKERGGVSDYLCRPQHDSSWLSPRLIGHPRPSPPYNCCTLQVLGFSYVLSDGPPERKHFYIGCICLSFLLCVISALLTVTQVDMIGHLHLLHFNYLNVAPSLLWLVTLHPMHTCYIPLYYHHHPHSKGTGKGCDASVWGWCSIKCWLTVTSLSALLALLAPPSFLYLIFLISWI